MKYKIIVDKQSRVNPSEEKREYIVDIEELRVKGNIYDSLVITKDEDYVMRRLSLSEYHVLSVLQEPIKEPLQNINIELFEGDNYIYLVDLVGNKFYAEYLVKNDFTDMYVTINQMNSAIDQTASQIELTVNQKLVEYATNEELESKVTELNGTIEAKAGEINLEVSKKVNNEELTGANIALRINNDTSEAKIKADKININGAISANGNFKVNTNGNMTCTNANVVGGKISLTDGTNDNPNFEVYSSSNRGTYTRITPGTINAHNSSSAYLQYSDNFLNIQGSNAFIRANLDSTNKIYLMANDVYCEDNVHLKHILYDSLESLKEDISLYEANATEIVKSGKIYTYKFKEQKDNKQHIGFVIPDKGGNYKTPEEVLASNKKSIDAYDMCSILWKAVQELTDKVERLEQEVRAK